MSTLQFVPNMDILLPLLYWTINAMISSNKFVAAMHVTSAAVSKGGLTSMVSA